MIDVKNLTRTYGTHTAVDDVSFTTRPGRVTGFLGPNGAGKSTVMRMILGLTTPTSGTATIGGVPYEELTNPGRHVGVLLDGSSQHGGRTGREILTLGALTMGLPRSRVDEVLAAVSLEPAEAGRRFRDYSLGMKQRLGIAHALLGDPQVLVLDEPANGLDPAGIRWMRDLLRDYARRGGTVLLSSHLLHEVELVADDLVLIGRGRIVAQGDQAGLAAQGGAATTLVSAEDGAALAASLARRGLEAVPAGEGLRVTAGTADVSRASIEDGIVLTDLRSGGQGLEELFLELTSSVQREDVLATTVAPTPTPTTAPKGAA